MYVTKNTEVELLIISCEEGNAIMLFWLNYELLNWPALSQSQWSNFLRNKIDVTVT